MTSEGYGEDGGSGEPGAALYKGRGLSCHVMTLFNSVQRVAHVALNRVAIGV